MRRWGRPLLTITSILMQADAYQAHSGTWPKHNTNLEWRSIDNALRYGLRGLLGGSSLALLLQERRGVRNVHNLPPLTLQTILQWAKAHFRRTGSWPNDRSGPVSGTAGETWYNVAQAVSHGHRGLAGGTTLAKFLAEVLGVRTRAAVPKLTIKQILVWADRHRARTGQWPRTRSGPIQDAPGETWLAVEQALERGTRGFRGGDSLLRVLHRYRRNVGRKLRTSGQTAVVQDR